MASVGSGLRKEIIIVGSCSGEFASGPKMGSHNLWSQGKRRASRPLRLGVLQVSSERSGGGYVFEQGLLRGIKTGLGSAIEIVEVAKLRGGGYCVLEGSPTLGAPKASRLASPNLEKLLIRQKIDIFFFLHPSIHMASLRLVPFLTTFWDFGPADLKHLREFSDPFSAKREDVYLNHLRRAHHVFVESDYTKNRLPSYGGVALDRITNIGMVAPLSEGNLPRRVPDIAAVPFFIYPARAWQHKNHEVLVAAAKILARRGHTFEIEFVGFDRSEGADVGKLVDASGLSEMLKISGFASREYVLERMSKAHGLLMPSMLGPTNYPPLEAAAMGTPSMISDAHMFDVEPPEYFTKLPTFDSVAWANAIESEILRGFRVLAPRDFRSQDWLGKISAVIQN